MSEKTVAARIKMARKMAGLNTQAALLEKIPGWSASRLGNYEAGISMPGPDDILLIAKATGSSPCWLLFGHGPIRPDHRDLQAIRHQNLCNTVDKLAEKRGAVGRLCKALVISRPVLNQYIDNPFKPISDAMAGKAEKFLNKTKGWMDEQHVDSDPLFLSFPDDIRELMSIYSGLEKGKRCVILKTVKVLAEELGGVG